MAQANTFTFANRVAGNRIQSVGHIPITITLTADTYATPTGVTVDIATQLAAVKPVVKHADVYSNFSGYSDAGHLAVFTKTATNGQFTVRLWNGTTEVNDGATTATIRALVPFCPGATS